jgi:hypothetical protein
MGGSLPAWDEVGASCDWGGCEEETVGVRWNDTGEGIEEWLSVCGRHAVDALVVPLYALGAS